MCGNWWSKVSPASTPGPRVGGGGDHSPFLCQNPPPHSKELTKISRFREYHRKIMPIDDGRVGLFLPCYRFSLLVDNAVQGHEHALGER